MFLLLTQVLQKFLRTHLTFISLHLPLLLALRLAPPVLWVSLVLLARFGGWQRFVLLSPQLSLKGQHQPAQNKEFYCRLTHCTVMLILAM